MEITHLNKKEFFEKVCDFEKNPDEWKFEGKRPCIIDFYATWCGPCKSLSPILEEIAKEYEGKIDVYKIDVDKEEELSGAFGIRSVPTVLWVSMADKPFISQGVMPKNEIKKIIEDKLLVR